MLLADRPTAQSTLATIERHRPTLYFGVPTLYAAQLQRWRRTPIDFSSVRACVSAGEALPAHMFHRWRDLTGTTILDGIGSTEALHIFISNQPGDVARGHHRPRRAGLRRQASCARTAHRRRPAKPAGC